MRRAAALALVLLATVPAQAGAHAQLVSSDPERGAQVEVAPAKVSFRFDEPVEAAFGALRVFDAAGARIDDGTLSRPDGDRTIATKLKGAGAGVYTATYRVVSADGHPVAGGLTFTVGVGGQAPSETVGELLSQQSSDRTTEFAYGVARAVGYAAIAVALGVLAFVLLCWRRLDPPAAARNAFGRRLRKVMAIACVTGAIGTVALVVFQAAVAGGTSFWGALNADAVDAVLHTQTGRALSARLLAWLALVAGMLLVARRAMRPGPGETVVVVAGAVGLAVTPGLGGHSAAASPEALALLADTVHVAAMSIWVGGIVALLLLLPPATRVISGTARAQVLNGAIGRFSGVALWAVIAVIASGVVQSVILVPSFADLLDTAFGRAVLIKSAIVCVLICFGAAHRFWLMPRLRAAGATTGSAGRATRSALRAEMALMAVLLAVAAALVSYSPSPAPTSVLSERFELGDAEVEVTASPLRPGAQEIHVYLFDPISGAPMRRSGEVAVALTQPAKRIGPLEVDLRSAGPGHLVGTETLAVAGDWRLRFERRQSRFDAFSKELELKIR